ncbi:MAG: peptide chain release factor N(5)-glutamine methyltransferase, partial [SAR202 cluster bacterium]|nr:peptide chain release factor N(5)-glutamine methyltransferase [SAR202 cluster bacterium]
MSARPLLANAVQRLRAAEIEDATREARLLLAHALGVQAETLLLEPDRRVSPDEAAFFERLLVRRLAREPLFYILGEREFYGLSFRVDRRALIPRPETELLVETVLELAKDRSADLTIADIGTGSGCIAVSLAVHLLRARIYATDI